MRKSHSKFSVIIILLIISITVKAQNKTSQISIGEKIEYKSTVLSEEIVLDIHLPRNYSEENKYPVLYLLDGKYFFTQLVSTVEFLSNCKYLQQELIPKFIVVGISTKDRNEDFTPTYSLKQWGKEYPTSGGAEVFFKFLKNELFTYIENNYSTNNKRLLTGWSFGGLFTVYCYLHHPDEFDYYLAVSPSLWWDNMLLTEQLKEIISKNTLAQKKLTMTIGALEKNPMASSIKDSFLPVMTKVADNSNFNFIEIEKENHETAPFLAFYRGLQSIFYDWSIPDSLLADKNFDEIEKIIFKHAREFGFKGDGILKAADFLSEIGIQQGNFNGAFKVAKYLTEKFPESNSAQANLAEIYYRLNDLKNTIIHIKKAIRIEEEKSNPNVDLLKYYKESLKYVTEEMNNGN